MYFQDFATGSIWEVQVLLASGVPPSFSIIFVSEGRRLASGWHGALCDTQAEPRTIYCGGWKDLGQPSQVAHQLDKRIWIEVLRPHIGRSLNACSFYGMATAFTLGHPATLVSCKLFDGALDHPVCRFASFDSESGAGTQASLGDFTTDCHSNSQAVFKAEALSLHAILKDLAHD